MDKTVIDKLAAVRRPKAVFIGKPLELDLYETVLSAAHMAKRGSDDDYQHQRHASLLAIQSRVELSLPTN